MTDVLDLTRSHSGATTSYSGTNNNTMVAEALYNDRTAFSTIVLTGSEKAYVEILVGSTVGSYAMIGIANESHLGTDRLLDTDAAALMKNGRLYSFGSTSYTTGPGGWGASARLMVAVDKAAGKWWVGSAGVWKSSGDPAAGTGFMHEDTEISSATSIAIALGVRSAGETFTLYIDETDFDYTIPTGFSALADFAAVPDVSVDLDALSASAAAQNSSLAAGAVTVSIQVVDNEVTAESTLIQGVAPDLTVNLSIPVSLAADAASLTPAPGEMNIGLAGTQITTTLLDIDTVTGEAILPLSGISIPVTAPTSYIANVVTVELGLVFASINVFQVDPVLARRIAAVVRDYLTAYFYKTTVNREFIVSRKKVVFTKPKVITEFSASNKVDEFSGIFVPATYRSATFVVRRRTADWSTPYYGPEDYDGLLVWLDGVTA